ncbi:MAG: alkaline phosphatase [Prosthecochloris sp.]|nr:alkaline phosphatase [Prosthecochloris sp.]
MQRFFQVRFFRAAIACLLLVISACAPRPSAPSSSTGAPRYIFFFIGDGMGMAQISLGAAVCGEEAVSAIRSLPVTGMISTSARDRYVTGSAAAGTALATGSRTAIGRISRTADNASDLTTVLELAEEQGMRTGVVSSVSLDHATPACFYAHAESRHQYERIASMMAESSVDYFGGGYVKADMSVDGVAKNEFPEIMRSSGFRVTRNAEELQSVTPGERVWAFDDVDRKAAMAYEIDRSDSALSLADYTRHGIRLLDNPRGFFMMVEGGKIDWACHANDGATTALDVRAFNDAVAEALRFYREHPDETLIIVTADHECGGLGLGNNETGYEGDPALLSYQQLSLERMSGKVSSWAEDGGVSLAMAYDSLRVFFGLGRVSADSALGLTAADSLQLNRAYQEAMDGYRDGEAYGKGDPLTMTAAALLNSRAGIGWTTRSHTAVDVPVFAAGAGAGQFSGYSTNAGLARRLMQVCGWSE